MVDEETCSGKTVPEGGWGWLIVIAVALSKMAFWGLLPCFAIVFTDVLETRPGEEGTTISSIIGIFIVCMEIAGMACPALFRRFSWRQVGTTGGVMYFVGSLGAAFSVTILQIILTYGVIQGVGYGLMLCSGMSAFTAHFQRRRTVAMAAALAGVGAGGLALPLAAQAAVARQGPRAAKLIFSAISAAAAAAQLALRTPRAHAPAPHLLRPLREHAEESRNNESNGKPIPNFDTKKRWSEAARALWRGAWRGAGRASGLNGQVVRCPRVLLTAAGGAVVHMADINLVALLPLHLRALLSAETQVARVVTALASGDLAGRGLMLLVGRWVGSRNRVAFALSAAATAAATLALSFVTSWYPLFISVAIIGMCKGVISTTLFLSVAEIVPPSKFPSAFAVILFMNMCAGVLSPLLGLVLDASGSIPVCLWLIAGLMGSCPVMWTLLETCRRP